MEKWVYHINRKYKAALLLAIVLGTILITNIFEKSTVTDLDKSFSSIYKDRLLPATYIFNITDHLYQKRLSWDSEARGSSQALLAHNTAIDKIITEFERTFLVKEEKIALQKLKNDLSSYNRNEAKLVSREAAITPEEKEMLNTGFEGLMSSLNLLSSIQVETAKELANESHSSITTSIMLSHFEIAMLIVVGTLINMLILSSRTITAAMKNGALDHRQN